MPPRVSLPERKDIAYITAHPVLHASLNMLIESAVIMKASAHARWPKCGLGSAVAKICSS